MPELLPYYDFRHNESINNPRKRKKNNKKTEGEFLAFLHQFIIDLIIAFVVFFCV